jgi:RNA polymerase sigma-70 factor (sigma-E family)
MEPDGPLLTLDLCMAKNPKGVTVRRTPSWEAAYCEYFAARQRAFMRTAYGIVGNWSVAEEATQATFAKLYAYWPRIEGDSIDAYARRVLVNTCIAASRKARREVSTEQVPEQQVEPDHGQRVDLLAAMRQLSPADRAVVTLRFLDDLSVADVSDALNVPPGTVKSRTSRALARLESLLTTGDNPENSPPGKGASLGKGRHHAA